MWDRAVVCCTSLNDLVCIVEVSENRLYVTVCLWLPNSCCLMETFPFGRRAIAGNKYR